MESRRRVTAPDSGVTVRVDGMTATSFDLTIQSRLEIRSMVLPATHRHVHDAATPADGYRAEGVSRRVRDYLWRPGCASRVCTFCPDLLRRCRQRTTAPYHRGRGHTAPRCPDLILHRRIRRGKIRYDLEQPPRLLFLVPVHPSKVTPPLEAPIGWSRIRFAH